MNDEKYALSPVLASEPPINNRALGSYEWERMFNAAKDILRAETHQKGDVTVTYGVQSTPKMVKTAQELCVELLKLATENLKTVTQIH